MNEGGATSGADSWPASVRAAAAGGLGSLRHVAVTGSTNDDLAIEARGGETTSCVLVADHQTAGRGRLDRRWDTDPGAALLVSVRLPVGAGDADRIVAAGGAAVRAAVDAAVPVTAANKWPNDVVIVDGPHPGKIAGVLAEYVAGETPVVIVGFGVNIAKPPIADASSVVECGGAADRDALLATTLTGIADRLGRPGPVREELRAHSATLGSRVRVQYANADDLVGTAVDLDDDGRLEVRSDDGTLHVVATGDVVHLRSAE